MQVTLTLKQLPRRRGKLKGWCKGTDEWAGGPLQYICNKGLGQVMHVPKRATKLQFVFTKRAPAHGQAFEVEIVQRRTPFDGVYRDLHINGYKGILPMEAEDVARKAVEKGYRFVSVYNVS